MNINNFFLSEISRIIYSSIIIIPVIFCSNTYLNWAEKAGVKRENNFKTKVVERGILVHGILTMIAFFLVNLLRLTFQSLIYKFLLFTLVLMALTYILFLKINELS